MFHNERGAAGADLPAKAPRLFSKPPSRAFLAVERKLDDVTLGAVKGVAHPRQANYSDVRLLFAGCCS